MEFNEIYNKDMFVVKENIQGTNAATATNYGIFFIAPFRCEVVRIDEVHQTLGTDGGAVTVTVERLQGTEALDAGDDLLATLLSLKATINTVQNGTLTATKENRILNRGDRLALKDAGVLTTVAGVCVTVKIMPLGKGHYG